MQATPVPIVPFDCKSKQQLLPTGTKPSLTVCLSFSMSLFIDLSSPSSRRSARRTLSPERVLSRFLHSTQGAESVGDGVQYCLEHVDTTDMHMHACTHTDAYTHACTQTHVDTHTHARTLTCFLPRPLQTQRGPPSHWTGHTSQPTEQLQTLPGSEEPAGQTWRVTGYQGRALQWMTVQIQHLYKLQKTSAW